MFKTSLSSSTNKIKAFFEICSCVISICLVTVVYIEQEFNVGILDFSFGFAITVHFNTIDEAVLISLQSKKFKRQRQDYLSRWLLDPEALANQIQALSHIQPEL